MNLEILFKFANGLALIGWLLLVFAPGSKWTRHLLVRPVIPALLAASYPILLLAGLPAFHEGGGFGSLAAVSRLFENKAALFAGWVHYLAFDLLVGSWVAADAQRQGIRHWLIVPALGLTFLFGPIGWLTYQLERLALRKTETRGTKGTRKITSSY